MHPIKKQYGKSEAVYSNLLMNLYNVLAIQGNYSLNKAIIGLKDENNHRMSKQHPYK